MSPKNPQEEKKADFKITDIKSGKVVHKFKASTVPYARTYEDLPALDGDYELSMEVAGTVQKRRFERHHFPWEGNKLGKSETVYPPFTPIEVAGAGEGASLKTVLREHKLGVGGLPSSIKAAGKELFAGPARLVSDGGELKGTLGFVSKKPNRVETKSELKGANGFAATAVGIWEEDGCLDWRLTMKSGSVKSLTLEIPLKAEMVPMIHALGKMRATTSAMLSDKDGVIWNADKTPQLIPHFCPYVFVGDQHRGLSWWAEAPNGWGWSTKSPNCELVRQGNIVTFKVHIVDVPTDITSPRTLRMGFMAAPVKPRPKDWLTRWNDRHYQFIATDICWFSESDCGGVQPAGENLELWKWIGDCYLPNRKPEMGRIEEIMQPVDKYLAVYGPDKQKMLSGEFRRMMKQHEEWGRQKIMTPIFYYNRSVWNNCSDFKTYMGEWMMQMFNREYFNGPSRNEIYIEPCESYLDYACWWWKKSFELCGNRGVYCDNYFNMQSWNFWNPDGLARNVIWALRYQAKRARQLMCEEGLDPFFWPHMSSQMVLPWMSFSEGQLDWEWNMGGGPVQRRFSRPYLKLATWGELGGIVPKSLMDRSGIKNAHDRNTFVAGLNLCGMTAYFNGDGSPFDDTIRNVYQKSPKLKFWNSFMEGPLPVKCNDPSVEWCVWCIPGKRAMLEALSWNSKGGQTAVFEIDYEALGMPKPVAEGAPLAESADTEKKKMMAGVGLDDEPEALDLGPLELSPIEMQNLILKAGQPLGKQGFSYKFGPYGVFVGELVPSGSSQPKKGKGKNRK